MKKLLATLAVIASVCGLAAADDKTKADVKLSGTYTIVSGEEEGKAVPNDRLEGSVVVFTETTIMGTDKAKKEFFSATYTLDTAKTPWVINMTSAAPADNKKKDTDDKKPAEKLSAAGLIKVDGETVTIIYALPGGKAPTEFKTGDKQQMFVMKKKAAK
jgi:uncharacterized protein (TIGR03067 family)